MNQKYPNSRKVESEIENTAGTICTPLRTNKYRGFTYSRRWGHREVFQKDKIVGVWKRGRDSNLSLEERNETLKTPN